MSNEDSTITDQAIKTAISDVRRRRGGRATISDEERARRAAVASEEKAKRDAERKAKREKKREEEQANRRPVHMKKVARAAERLPAISDKAKDAVQTILNSGFDRNEITGVIAHVTHRLREEATLKAQAVEVGLGDTVRINDASSRYNGQLGRVVAVQRIRCYVEPLTAAEKKVYLFLSDVEKVEDAEAQAVTDVFTSIDEPLSQVG